jgi:hypothetical protein
MHIGGKRTGIGGTAALRDQERSGDDEQGQRRAAQTRMSARTRLSIRARAISPMATRIVPDHPPLTQTYPTQISSGEKRQLASAFSSLALVVRRCRRLPEKLPTSGKTPRRTSTKRPPNHVLIVGNEIPIGNAVVTRKRASVPKYRFSAPDLSHVNQS